MNFTIPKTSVLAGCLVLLHLAGGARAQSTWYVDASNVPPGSGTSADPFASLQAAIAAPTSLAGDMLLVAPGTYHERLDFLGKDLNVVGVAGAPSTIVDAGLSGPVARFVQGETAACVVQGLTLRNGLGESSAMRGGGLYIEGSSPSFAQVVVRDCRGIEGAGVCVRSGSPTFFECGITFNAPPAGHAGNAYGIGVYVAASATPLFTDSQVSYNRYWETAAIVYGGGLYGGGMYLRTTFLGNIAYQGGGASSGGATPVFQDCIFRRNETGTLMGACDIGGGVLGPALLYDCTLFKNKSCLAGGAAAAATLVRCAIEDNQARILGTTPGYGGGTYDCLVSDSSYSNNIAHGLDASSPGTSSNGGGAYGGTQDRCLFTSNEARHGHGGGAHSVTALGSKFQGNRATGGLAGEVATGGALAFSSATRCILRGNEATLGGGGVDTHLERCTVFANRATLGAGGLLFLSGPHPVRNTIVRGNELEEVVRVGGTVSFSYCDVEGSLPAGVLATEVFDLDPQFFGPEGGDFALKPGSPCIDAGHPATTVDWDGTRADIGALAFTPAHCAGPYTYCVAKVNSQACTPRIASVGGTSLSGPDDLRVQGFDFVNRENGLLVWGRASTRASFGGGTLCVAAPLVRTAIVSSGGSASPLRDCSGTFDVPFTHAYLAAHGLVAGDTWYAQFLARDTGLRDGTGMSLSDAIEVTLCP